MFQSSQKDPRLKHMPDSYEDRLARHYQLQAQSMRLLRANPEGWQRFMRRNITKRAIPFTPDDFKR